MTVYYFNGTFTWCPVSKDLSGTLQSLYAFVKMYKAPSLKTSTPALTQVNYLWHSTITYELTLLLRELTGSLLYSVCVCVCVCVCVELHMCVSNYNFYCNLD